MTRAIAKARLKRKRKSHKVMLAEGPPVANRLRSIRDLAVATSPRALALARSGTVLKQASLKEELVPRQLSAVG